jgi:hypothetical protein
MVGVVTGEGIHVLLISRRTAAAIGERGRRNHRERQQGAQDDQHGAQPEHGSEYGKGGSVWPPFPA